MGESATGTDRSAGTARNAGSRANTKASVPRHPAKNQNNATCNVLCCSLMKCARRCGDQRTALRVLPSLVALSRSKAPLQYKVQFGYRQMSVIADIQRCEEHHALLRVKQFTVLGSQGS
jgi:hypothetical protein